MGDDGVPNCRLCNANVVPRQFDVLRKMYNGKIMAKFDET